MSQVSYNVDVQLSADDVNKFKAELLSSFTALVKTLIKQTAYDGFKPELLRKFILKNWKPAMLIKALTILLRKGANMKMKGANKELQELYGELKSKGVLATAKDDLNLITLPRLAAAFPDYMVLFANALWSEGEFNYLFPVSDYKVIADKYEIPICFLIPGIVSIIPGEWAEGYLVYTLMASRVLDTKSEGKNVPKTVKLNINLGGRFSAVSFDDCAKLFQDYGIGYRTNQFSQIWSDVSKWEYSDVQRLHETLFGVKPTLNAKPGKLEV